MNNEEKKDFDYITKHKTIKLKEDINDISTMDRYTENVVRGASTTTLTKTETKSLFLSLLENIKSEIEELKEYQDYDIKRYLKECEIKIRTNQKNNTTHIKHLNLIKNDGEFDLKKINQIISNFELQIKFFDKKIKQLIETLKFILCSWFKRQRSSKKKTKIDSTPIGHEDIPNNLLKSYLELIGVEKVDDLTDNNFGVRKYKRNNTIQEESLSLEITERDEEHEQEETVAEIEDESEVIKKEFIELRAYDFEKYFHIMKEHFMNRETRVIFEKNIENKKLFKFYENGVIEIVEACSTIRRVI